MANLPAELIGLLIDKLHYFEDRLTLEACGLVCKAWLYSSRARVFADVYLHKDNITSFCDIAESSILPIMEFVRNMTLEYIEDPSLSALHRVRSLFWDEAGTAISDLNDDIQRLGPFPAVKFLRLEMSSEMLDRHSVFFGKIFPNLWTLDIDAVNTGSMGSILRAIASFPSLNSLKIRDLDHKYTITDPISPAYQFPPGLRAVDISARDVDDFFRWLLSLDTVPIFPSVSTWNAWPDENSQLGKYLCRIGPGLRHLCLDSYMCETEKQYVTDPVAFSHCTGLRSLKVSAEHEEVSRILLKILPLLHSSELASITLENSAFHEASPSNVTLDRWHKIDGLLGGENFVGLKTFRIIGDGWTGGCGVDSAAEQMPSSVARGILQLD
ncbi:hypothetical protein C8R44DRAFT_854423 [Mycena epipterygia]|nr:hypothetical protein C8R44DRAFT_854423 [Mycena epipterygia]